MGDTLSSIAAKFGMTVQALKWANPQSKSSSPVLPGQIFVIPLGGAFLSCSLLVSKIGLVNGRSYSLHAAFISLVPLDLTFDILAWLSAQPLLPHLAKIAKIAKIHNWSENVPRVIRGQRD